MVMLNESIKMQICPKETLECLLGLYIECAEAWEDSWEETDDSQEDLEMAYQCREIASKIKSALEIAKG
jgi:hypothetical protein